MGKLIKCRCSEPIAHSREAQQPWADVWLRYTSKPKRKVIYYAPTLVSKGSLEHEIEFEQRFIKEHPEFKAESNLAAMVGVMDKLKTQPIVIGSDWDHGTPTIYTASELIDRAEAERMLAAMMRHLGFESVRFKWKRPRILIRPVG